MINFQEMEPATKEWMGEHGYSEPCCDIDKPVRYGRFEYDEAGECTIIVGHYENGWFADVENEYGETVDTRAHVHPDIAIMEALCFLIAPIAFAQEGNCEDAVNRAAYESLALMLRGDSDAACNGSAANFHDRYEVFMLDVCMGYARKAVKFYAGDLWEEF